MNLTISRNKGEDGWFSVYEDGIAIWEASTYTECERYIAWLN